ncbi:acetamidase/formamidase family protein [Psychrobacillus sp. NPDC058041]|uniref:acetamidase/formamidase family protein n=1 Tax=Psychrobacillus sp. NPDC058041 TaxID=3346310 RepID=UPI0036DA2181
MHYLKREQSVYSFNKDHKPVLHIQPGENVLFQIYDCFTNQIQSDEHLITSIDFSKVNPATGPVYIEGALPGQTLKVEIHDIKVRDWGVISTLPEIGVLIHRAETKTKIVKVENDIKIHFNDDISFEAKPMIGVIGCAPAGEEVPCGLPGDHGGNIDNHVITKGSIVYLPINVEGALFGLGDIHASMGDGEICGTGVEISGEVETTISTLPNTKINRPIVETKDDWYSIASHTDTNRAIQIACEDMQDLLVDKWNLSQTDAYLLMSVAGDVQMCQCCKPSPVDVIARFRMPKLENMPRLID